MDLIRTFQTPETIAAELATIFLSALDEAVRRNQLNYREICCSLEGRPPRTCAESLGEVMISEVAQILVEARNQFDPQRNRTNAETIKIALQKTKEILDKTGAAESEEYDDDDDNDKEVDDLVEKAELLTAELVEFFIMLFEKETIPIEELIAGLKNIGSLLDLRKPKSNKTLTDGILEICLEFIESEGEKYSKCIDIAIIQAKTEILTSLQTDSSSDMIQSQYD